MKIQILGTGCAKCKKLYEQTQQAVTQSGVQVQIEKVEKFDDILKFGVPFTPALVINGEVKSAGKIPETSQIVTWIINEEEKHGCE